MKEQKHKSRYSEKYRRKTTECNKIGSRAFTIGSSGKKVPFPMPLLTGVEV